VPRDAGAWYACGDESLGQDSERTWGYWRRSLELSDRFLPLILEKARDAFSPREVMDHVIPDRPGLLLTAAFLLYPETAAAARRPFQERALATLGRQPRPPEAKDLYLRAQLQVALGNPAAALQAYENALRRSPQEVAWRYEFARFLRSQGQLTEARRELVTLLRQQYDYAPARQLLEEVTGELAERN
jgi:tetratricopeptide (TPR) repeat protein